MWRNCFSQKFLQCLFILVNLFMEPFNTDLHFQLNKLLLFSWIIIIIIQFWSRFIPINGDGWIYPTLTAISATSTLHLAQFMASSFSKPTFLLFFSTCVFDVFFGHPCFLLPFTSNFNAFLKTCPSSLLNTLK